MGNWLEYIRDIVKRNLKDLRESAGLKGYEVAERAGISQASYSRFESKGWVSDPEELEKLALFYNVPSSRFFFDPNLQDYKQPVDPETQILKDLQSLLNKYKS